MRVEYDGLHIPPVPFNLIGRELEADIKKEILRKRR
jgi:hypothetical protein